MDFLFKKLKGLISTKTFTQDMGAIAIMAAILLVVLLGFGALTVDVGIWYNQKNKLQVAADAGATAGVIALSKTGEDTYKNYVNKDLVLNGCSADTGCTVVAINNPPASGPNVGNDTAVEVILSQPAETILSSIIFATPPTIGARAVAGLHIQPLCVISLKGAATGIEAVGLSKLNAENCGIYVNSPASDAITAKGGAEINAKLINVVGGTDTSGGGTINGTVNTGVPPLDDPQSGLTIPSFSGCDQTNYALPTGSDTLNPGVYCGGITVTTTGTLTMNPGTYILTEQSLPAVGSLPGDFRVTSQATVNGNGVTIILTHAGASAGFGTATIAGGATLNLSAPTSGDFSGILFYGDRASSPGPLPHMFVGGSTQNLDGVIYFPTTDVQFSGNAGGQTGCTQLIASGITLTGTSTFTNGCLPPNEASFGTFTFLE